MKKYGQVATWLLAVGLTGGCTQASPAGPTSPTGAEPQPLPEGQPLDAGAYAIELDGHAITFEVPSGWEGWAYGVFPSVEETQPPTGRGFSLWLVDNIYADPCRWSRGVLDPAPQPSAQGLATALKAQWGGNATPPAMGSLDGEPVIEMDLRVPPALDLSTCARDGGDPYFLYWPQRGGGGRYSQGPGQREHLWIFDLDGARLVVDVSYFPATSTEARAELWDIARSVNVG